MPVKPSEEELKRRENSKAFFKDMKYVVEYHITKQGSNDPKPDPKTTS